MGSLTPTSAPLALAAVLTPITHYALFTANPITAGSLASEQANANGYARPAEPTMSSNGDDEEESTAAPVWTRPRLR